MAGRLGVVTLAEAVSYLPMLRAQEALSAMVKRGDLPSLALARFDRCASPETGA